MSPPLPSAPDGARGSRKNERIALDERKTIPMRVTLSVTWGEELGRTPLQPPFTSVTSAVPGSPGSETDDQVRHLTTRAPPRTFGWVGRGTILHSSPCVSSKPRIPPNPVFSSDLGHLFFVIVLARFFLSKIKKWFAQCLRHGVQVKGGGRSRKSKTVVRIAGGQRPGHPTKLGARARIRPDGVARRLFAVRSDAQT